MSERHRAWWVRILRPRFFTPKGFGTVAAAFVVAFLVCHVAGLRSYTCALCGQPPTGDAADGAAYALGLLYIVFYTACIVAAPILAIASLIFRGLEVVARREPRPRGRWRERPSR